ncbi:Fe2OG dioxygenase domain-containing protein [Mycena kentingensis (nom. inval.)]|nr:Fe2OG dioxygenase domain-containing protein [Mycena kentingensis (nom. inval.)]
MPGTWTVGDHLDVLRKSLKTSIPYISGVHLVRAQDLGLYFNTGPESVEFVDFAAPEVDPSQLEKLSAACAKATFGTDHGDVLDESYRKAGKLELDQFAAQFDVHSAGLVDAIAQDFIVNKFPERRFFSHGEEKPQVKVLRAELYKLNVYGPGAFFKEHKDTPRSKDMIGSLVVVLPTEHEGGALTLSQGDNQWSFDSASRLKGASEGPKIAYIAFYSDVTHAVEPVVSGYRVTLTYNLFVAPAVPNTTLPTTPDMRAPSLPEIECETALRGVASRRNVAARGRVEDYPAPVVLELGMLKGCDARLRNVAQMAGLEPRVRLVYQLRPNDAGKGATPRYVVLDELANSSDPDYDPKPGAVGYTIVQTPQLQRKFAVEGPSMQVEMKDSPREDGMTADRDDDDGDCWYYRERVPLVSVLWVTPPTSMNLAETEGYFGNDYQEESIYGDAELFVRIPPANDSRRSS